MIKKLGKHKSTAVKIALIGVAGLLGFKLIIQPLFRAVKKSLSELRAEAKQIYKKQKPTYSDAQLEAIANIIYQDLRYSALDDDKKDAIIQLKKMNNTADVYRLMEIFGKKQEYWFGIPNGSRQTLPEFVAGNFKQKTIQDLNIYYRNKLINWSW